MNFFVDGSKSENIDFSKSFPNIDYNLYGYNILKGFPLSDGIDPGFTRPIFAANFSAGHTTVDGR